MELKHDCVRALLLTIEEEAKIDNHFSLDHLKEMPRLKDFDRDDIAYTAIKLKEADFINAEHFYSDDTLGGIVVSNLTYAGHQFLDNIRDGKVWKEVKKQASNFSSISLAILAELAAAYIKSTLNI